MLSRSSQWNGKYSDESIYRNSLTEIVGKMEIDVLGSVSDPSSIPSNLVAARNFIPVKNKCQEGKMFF